MADMAADVEKLKADLAMLTKKVDFINGRFASFEQIAPITKKVEKLESDCAQFAKRLKALEDKTKSLK